MPTANYSPSIYPVEAEYIIVSIFKTLLKFRIQKELIRLTNQSNRSVLSTTLITFRQGEEIVREWKSKEQKTSSQIIDYSVKEYAFPFHLD